LVYSEGTFFMVNLKKGKAFTELDVHIFPKTSADELGPEGNLREEPVDSPTGFLDIEEGDTSDAGGQPVKRGGAVRHSPSPVSW
jgi:hypothetical protein